MKHASWMRVRQLFERALELAPGERASLLDTSCAGEDDVRREVESLLQRDALAAGFLEPPEQSVVLLHSDFAPGTRIGRYELQHVLGSGGMGTVYAAFQEEPRRTVALKMMRFGLRSPSAVRRFRLEAEVLARLQHPGIAQVFESGTHVLAGAEHPYFAMELVPQARNLLDHARDRALGLRERIELFLQVCDALAHGHQRGVIHRDLKPANILVDSSGRPKVIDFGIARVTASEPIPLRAPTLGDQILGTLAYMSPEQIGDAGAEVDTRSDVYALGCMLHELLTGRLPLDIEGRPLQEVVHVVATEEARRPGDVPLELGWILLKCLAKEPDHRYASASELAADLRRHSRHEPVLAGPPSRGYRLRKYARRHRVFLTSVGAVILALALGLVQAEVEARTADRARELAEREADKAWGVTSFLARTLTSISPLEKGEEVRIADVLEEAARSLDRELGDRPEVEALVENVIGKSYLELRLYEEAEEHLTKARDYVDANLPRDDPLAIDVLANQTHFLFLTHEWTEAERLGRDVEALALRTVGPDHELTLRIQGTLAELLLYMRKLDESERRYDEHIDGLSATHGARHPEVVASLGGRALVWLEQGKSHEALEELERVLDLCQEIFSPDHYRVWNARYNVARACQRLGRHDDAEALLREMLAHCRERFGDDHLFTSWVLGSLGQSLVSQDRDEEAVPVLEEAVRASLAAHGKANVSWLGGQVLLATAHAELGRTDEVEAICRQAPEEGAGLVPEDHGYLETLHRLLAGSLRDQGRSAEAEDVLRTTGQDR